MMAVEQSPEFRARLIRVIVPDFPDPPGESPGISHALSAMMMKGRAQSRAPSLNCFSMTLRIKISASFLRKRPAQLQRKLTKRSHPDFSVASSVAKLIRTNPGAPNGSPGTRATRASRSTRSQNRPASSPDARYS